LGKDIPGRQVTTIRSPAYTRQESERQFFDFWPVIYSPTVGQFRANFSPILWAGCRQSRTPANPNTDPLKMINPDWICKETPTRARCSYCEFGAKAILVLKTFGLRRTYRSHLNQTAKLVQAETTAECLTKRP
jgi:hypothetical protein